MSASLEHDLSERMPEIQDAFAAVLHTFCGGEAGIGDICETLGLHRKLAWQVRGVAMATDPSRTVRMMPSRAGVETLVESIAGRPGGEALVQRVRMAAASFEELVSRHAQDRSWLEMLAEATAADDEADERWREQAFRGNSFIWGAHARVLLSVMILNRSQSRPGWIDMAAVRGLIGFARVRPNIRWLISQSVIMDDDGPSHAPQRSPLDPQGASAAGGVPVLAELCSQPLPRLQRSAGPAPGMVQDSLLEGPVGQMGQQTIYTGEIVRNVGAAFATHENKSAYFGGAVRTPARVLLYDQFVHRDLFPGIVERELCVFGEMNSPATYAASDRLPVSERIQRLGPGLARARCTDLPEHRSVLASLFAGLGWNPEEFEHYRVRMAFPPMPASVMIRHALPSPPSGAEH